MKAMRRMFALVLVLALALGCAPTTQAADAQAQQAADHLFSLGLFLGTGIGADGEPVYELDRAPTRAEAVTMLVRLLGKTAEATGEEWTSPFTDVPVWAVPYVGYAYSKGLTMGISATAFGSSNPTSASMYITFVLRALGYSSSADFRWDAAWELSDRLGITDGRFRTNSAFTRGGVAIISDSALDARYKGSNRTLLETLTANGAVPAASAVPSYSFSRNGNYVRQQDETVYDFVLGDFDALMRQAEADGISQDERYVRLAKAEAALLDSAVMIPNTTQGGAFTISRIAPRTVPYVQWGNDDDRWFGMVISGDNFLTPDERTVFLEAWRKAVAGEGAYDPAAIMRALGHSIKTDYTTTFTTAPVTLDWLNTSSQSDTEITVQTVTGLVQYDNLNRMQPALAERWEVSDDGLTYTFHIRPGVYWYTSDGQAYAEVTAADFVAGFHHMLDAQGGLEWLVEGVVAGAGEYLYEGGSFSQVGYRATDRYTLVVTLEKPTSYFLTMLTYTCFLPICDSFYRSCGGVYGIAAFDQAASSGGYTFGRADDVSSQVYCGPFLLKKLQPGSEILAVRNRNYFNDAQTTLNTIRWIYDVGMNMTDAFHDTVYGRFSAITLGESNGTLELAKKEGYFTKYAFVSETTSTTYFGGLNLNRGTFILDNGAAASGKTARQKIDTATALQNKAFRQALQFAFDKGSVNETSRGEELRYTNLRNMYTHPEFVSLSADITVDGVTFPSGTFYGRIVQYYLNQLGSPIIVADQADGWYHPAEARMALKRAKEELGDRVSWPITIDVVYYGPSDINTAQAKAYKSSIEKTLGAKNVTVHLIETSTAEDYYAGGYRARNGASGNFDMFYGSGWGPDYGDPSTYLDTFLGYGEGYMRKVIGLF